MYIHHCLFSPPVTTLVKAIDNNQLLSFPVSRRDVVKYLPPSSATIKGHLNRVPKNFRSTTKQEKEITLEEDLHPPQEVNAACELFCFTTLADTNTGTIYTDLTGRFPVQSFQGHQYIFCTYVYDANAILVCPLKSRETID